MICSSYIITHGIPKKTDFTIKLLLSFLTDLLIFMDLENPRLKTTYRYLAPETGGGFGPLFHKPKRKKIVPAGRYSIFFLPEKCAGFYF
jgi:hypothetical protein